jgi:hypothetical protein
MKLPLLISLLALFAIGWAQESDSGFELRGTAAVESIYSHLLTEHPRDGSPFTGGFRAVLYPTLKLNRHWSFTGSVQAHSRPYFFEELSTQGYGVKTDILQAHLDYSQFWHRASLAVHAGMLSSAFGSFLVHYDDSENPLIDSPVSYGYYYKPISDLGLAGVEADATYGNLDLRAQFVNSSPANRRSIFDHDQYGNWAGGIGYTLRQGFHIGTSAYHGPYLDRQYAYYFRGEAPPRDLPATAVGADVQWGWGHWNVSGEWQWFQMDYRVIPTFRQQIEYGEARRVLSPRWYLAARLSRTDPSIGFPVQIYEEAVGFRPNARQLIKVGYQAQRGAAIHGADNNALAVQVVTSFRALSLTPR